MIPIIIGGIMGASALYGVFKGGKSVVDQQDASATNKDAQSVVAHARQVVDQQRSATTAIMTDYGSRKLRAFNGVIAEFVTVFGTLKNVEQVASPELDKLNLGDTSTHALEGLRSDYQMLADAGLGLGAGLTGGAALAFGAYNGTMALATAGTGTAISSLGGVAATNATLAWLGGGTLAAGGMGVAGGMMVLGATVAGPAIALLGHIVGSKAESELATAKANLSSARLFATEAETIAGRLEAIQRVTHSANTTFSKISSRLRKATHDLQATIVTHGTNYATYPQDAREAVYVTVKHAQLIKAMIDTPILDSEGRLVLASEKRINELAGAVAS